MSNKTLAVPRKDLDSIEEARLELYELLDEQCKDLSFLVSFTNITRKFYLVAHKNYPEVSTQNN